MAYLAISHVGGPLTPIESLTSLCIMMSVFLRKTTEIVFFFLGQCSVVIMEDNHKESWNKVSLCFATLINKNKIKKMSFSLTLLLFNSKKKKKKNFLPFILKKKKNTLKKVWNLKIEPCYITNVYIIYINNKGKKNSDIIYVLFFFNESI